MFESLGLPFVQRGIAEVLILSVGAGLLGTWIVLRDLAFYSHAVGTAAFPGLVLAAGLGFAAPLGALGAAAVFALALAALARTRQGDDRGGEVALVLVGMLALGIILASDVFHSSTGVESLLFGSLLLIDPGDIALALGTSVLAVLATALIGERWLAHGFAGGVPARGGALIELALLIVIALASTAALTAVGALLVSSLFVVPAATTRPWFGSLRAWQLATVALTAGLGFAGVLISVELNAPPGATIAVLGGLTFAVSGTLSLLRARNLSRVAAATVLGALALGLSACGPSEASGPRAVATTPVVADLVSEVGGPSIDVVGILSPSSDPHTYEPRPADIEAIASADVVFASGGDIDAWIDNAVSDSGSDAKVVKLSDGVPRPLASDEEGSDGIDPHWWHDPRNVERVIPRIAGELKRIDPAASATIARRAAAYRKRVAALDATLARCYSSVPARQREMVTDHDAFDYLARRYDIRIVGAVIPALTTEAEPSAGELSDLRDVIEREHVRTIFPETSVNTKLAETIASETGADATHRLYGDTLGTSDSSGDTYLHAESANADAIVAGMTGGKRGCP